jgi:hypothetical protein
MKKEQLLIPRYKVIALWPGCQWSLGSVLIHIGNGNYDCKKEPTINGLRNPEYFSANLQPLPWWKDRRVDDMPDYIKNIRTGEIFPYTDELKVHGTGWMEHEKLEPASKEDYELYLTKPNAEG